VSQGLDSPLQFFACHRRFSSVSFSDTFPYRLASPMQARVKAPILAFGGLDWPDVEGIVSHTCRLTERWEPLSIWKK